MKKINVALPAICILSTAALIGCSRADLIQHREADQSAAVLFTVPETVSTTGTLKKEESEIFQFYFTSGDEAGTALDGAGMAEEETAAEPVEDIYDVYTEYTEDDPSADQEPQMYEDAAPAVEAEYVTAAVDDPYETPTAIYLGNYRITFYCDCPACCGSWSGSATASGAYPMSWHTVAAELPFGTRLLIDGHEYVVEDRGVPDGCIDIYVNDHQEALDRGLYYTDVYEVIS